MPRCGEHCTKLKSLQVTRGSTVQHWKMGGSRCGGRGKEGKKKKEKGEKERECDVLVQCSIQNECIVCTPTSQRFVLLRLELSAMFSGSNTVAVQKRQNVTPVCAAASPKM